MNNFDMTYYVVDVSNGIWRIPKWVLFFDRITQPISTVPTAQETDIQQWFKNLLNCAKNLQTAIDENMKLKDLTDIETSIGDNDIENLLASLLLQICNYESLQEGKKKLPNSAVLCDRCNSHLRFLTDIFAVCGTLSCVEGQLKSYERQIKNYGTRKDTFRTQTQFYKFYWKESPSNAFFEELLEAILKYQNSGHANYESEDRLMSGLQRLWDLCSHQPLPAMFIPILFTLYGINPSNDSAIYPKMKTMRQYKNAKNPSNILGLYDSISKIFANYTTEIVTCQEMPDVLLSSTKDVIAFSPTVPRFKWKALVEAFCACQGDISSSDRIFVEQCFVLCRDKNGLPKSILAEISKKSFGKNLKYLLKLCNYNTYLLLKSGVPATGEIRTALDALKANRIIIPRHGSYKEETEWLSYQRYFFDYYTDETSLSSYGLIRYCKLPLSIELFDAMPLGIAELQGDFLLTADNHISKLCCRYMEEQFQNQRLLDRPQTVNEIAAEKHFCMQIIEHFSFEDFSRFVDNPSNLQEESFLNYLCEFCKTHNIESYDLATARERVHMEYAAFATILDLSKIYLGERIMNCWTSLLSAVLYS